MANWTHWYDTKGIETRKDGSKRQWHYRTKSLTPYHAHLRAAHPSASTIECTVDPTWFGGIFAVVIEQSADQKAKDAARAEKRAALAR